MNISFKNRIALYYMVATAIVVAIVFCVIQLSVKSTVYNNIDNDLLYEAHKHTSEIFIEEDSLVFLHKAEWLEREHREVQANPVFVQMVGTSGNIMDKSPNLKGQQLPFEQGRLREHFNVDLNEMLLRQLQIPIVQNDQVKGYMLVAMSLKNTKMTITNLRYILLILYPLVLVGLFFISRFLAGKSIAPIKRMTKTTNKITQSNLNERLELPRNKDELYQLASSINELLSRLEESFRREKQFTSDASHQLRTPLSVIKGTLEVLVRKPRSEREYKEKINYSMEEIDRMVRIVEQLLLLARLDNNLYQYDSNQKVDVLAVLDEVIERNNEAIKRKGLKIKLNTHDPIEINANPYHLELIFDNLLSNAIKYAFENTCIEIDFKNINQHLSCTIADQGIGIKKEDIATVFHPFFRSEALKHKKIKGSGLGLSIVKKACEASHITFYVDSTPGQGTSVTLHFPNLV